MSRLSSSQVGKVVLSARDAVKRFDEVIRNLEGVARRDAEPSATAAAHAELRALHARFAAVEALLECEVARRLALFETEDGCILTEGRGIIEDANAAAGRMLGMAPEAMAKKLLISFVARRDTRAFREQLRDIQASTERSARAWPVLQLQLRPRGGSPFLVRMGARPVVGADGRRIGFCWSMRPASPAGPTLDMIRSRVEASVASLHGALVEAQAQARVLGSGVQSAEAHAEAIRALTRVAEDREKLLEALADVRDKNDAPGEPGAS
jgi:PAS domain S-box-containing protein